MLISPPLCPPLPFPNHVCTSLPSPPYLFCLNHFLPFFRPQPPTTSTVRSLLSRLSVPTSHHAPYTSSSAERRNPPSALTETEEDRMSREAKERAEVLRRIVERPPTDEGEPDREAMTRRKVCPSPNFCSICKVVDQRSGNCST